MLSLLFVQLQRGSPWILTSKYIPVPECSTPLSSITHRFAFCQAQSVRSAHSVQSSRSAVVKLSLNTVGNHPTLLELRSTLLEIPQHCWKSVVNET